ncbi:MAG: hypothetical protein PHO02_04715 [Candidatus Nanoarchaeia archaeon]|nr:hypothetical protein [Candidatus Nanoarchaeia archaeon]
MINSKQQEGLFANAASKLKNKITCYAAGGTAMLFYGLKETTKDIDLIFTAEKDRQQFIDAIQELGYKSMNPIKIYGKKENRPMMLTRGDERFDLFLIKVISFSLSKTMQERCEQTHEYGSKLVLKIMNPHDILLMKCATDRIKDREDARSIIENIKINWKSIIDEANSQVIHGHEKKAVFELGCFLDEIKTELNVNVPQWVIEELYSLLEEETKKQVKNPNKKA